SPSRQPDFPTTTVSVQRSILASPSLQNDSLGRQASLRLFQYFGGGLVCSQRRRRHVVQNCRKCRQAASSRQLSCPERYLLDLAVHRSMRPHFSIPPRREAYADSAVARHSFVEFRLSNE